MEGQGSPWGDMSPQGTQTERQPVSDGALTLVQRDAEVARIDQAVAEASRGAGIVLYLEGGPGSGRSRLLAAVLDAARQAGVCALRATGRDAERGYRFGVVVQLLETRWLQLDGGERERLMQGPARAVARLMSGDLIPSEEEFAVVHGVLSLVRELAARTPGLVLAVDDVEHADAASARLLAYLAARVTNLPVVLAAAGPPPPAADGAALTALKGVATVLPLAPLTPAAVAEVVDARYPTADPALRATCAHLTGGNPLLLAGLLDEVARDGAPLTAEQLPGLMPAAALRMARAGLDRAGVPARRLAATLALAGDPAALAQAAAAADLSTGEAADAARALAAAGLVTREEPIRFAAPLLRRAVETITSVERYPRPGVDPAPSGLSTLVARDELEGALQILGGGNVREAERADPALGTRHRRLQAWSLWHQGAIAEAYAVASASVVDPHGPPSELAGVIAACHLELGQLDHAHTTLAALRAPDQISPAELPVLLDVRAQLRLAQGRPAEALVDALEAGRRALAVGDDPGAGVVSWRSTAALARLALDEPDGARQLAEEEHERAATEKITRVVIRCLRVLGLAADGQPALDLLNEAVAIGAKHPPRLEYLRALVDLGSAMRRANRRSSARTPLTAALELCGQRGATALARRAQMEIAACGSRQGGSRVTGVQALTPSERRVATLAAAGHTTRQIAAELFVTPKTIEFHLRHVYRKLGIASTRAELARAVAGASERISLRE